jgi:hypothetical protein
MLDAAFHAARANFSGTGNTEGFTSQLTCKKKVASGGICFRATNWLSLGLLAG